MIAVFLLGATATTSLAAGAVSINWDSGNCNGPIDIAVQGGFPVYAWVSVLGQSQTAQAYQVVTTGGSGAFGAIRDAWRFDPTGCQGPAFFTLYHLAPPVETRCPSFQGNLQSLQIKDFSFDPSTGKVRITLANAYPNNGLGNPNATHPTQRYLLASYMFDLTFANAGMTPPDRSTCGGVEVPVCFHITSASWLDLNSNEIPWAVAQEYVTTNDPTNDLHCPGATPAVSKTWGAVKSQYRE